MKIQLFSILILISFVGTLTEENYELPEHHMPATVSDDHKDSIKEDLYAASEISQMQLLQTTQSIEIGIEKLKDFLKDYKPITLIYVMNPSTDLLDEMEELIQELVDSTDVITNLLAELETYLKQELSDSIQDIKTRLVKIENSKKELSSVGNELMDLRRESGGDVNTTQNAEIRLAQLENTIKLQRLMLNSSGNQLHNIKQDITEIRNNLAATTESELIQKEWLEDNVKVSQETKQSPTTDLSISDIMRIISQIVEHFRATYERLELRLEKVEDTLERNKPESNTNPSAIARIEELENEIKQLKEIQNYPKKPSLIPLSYVKSNYLGFEL